jgi:hypothetical protein
MPDYALTQSEPEEPSHLEDLAIRAAQTSPQQEPAIDVPVASVRLLDRRYPDLCCHFSSSSRARQCEHRSTGSLIAPLTRVGLSNCAWLSSIERAMFKTATGCYPELVVAPISSAQPAADPSVHGRPMPDLSRASPRSPQASRLYSGLYPLGSPPLRR